MLFKAFGTVASIVEDGAAMKEKTKRYEWTEDAIEILRSEYARTRDLSELAERLGCKVTTLYNKAHLLHIERGQNHGTKKFETKKYTKEQFETARRLYPDTSNRTICVVTGVSLGALRKWRYLHGWLKSDRYRKECKEYSKEKELKWRRAHNPEYRERRKEWDRRYREKKRIQRLQNQ